MPPARSSSSATTSAGAIAPAANAARNCVALRYPRLPVMAGRQSEWQRTPAGLHIDPDQVGEVIEGMRPATAPAAVPDPADGCLDLVVDRRRVDTAVEGATGDQGSALAERVDHVGVHLVPGPVADQRADDRARNTRVAALEHPGACGELRQERLVERPLDQDPAGVQADLALVQEPAVHREIDRVVELSVSEHDHRVVSAEFHDGPLQRPAGALRQHPSDRDASDEVDAPHVGAVEDDIRDRARAARAVSDDVEHAGREPRLRGDLRDDEPRGDGRLLRRLEHDGVAGRQRQQRRPPGQHVCSVPRGETGHDAQRPAHGGRVGSGRIRPQHLAIWEIDPLRHLLQHRTDQVLLELRERHRATRLPGHDLGDLRAPPLHHVGGGQEQPLLAGRWQRGPRRECPSGSADRRPRFVGTTVRDLQVHLTGVRIEVVEHPRRFDPPAVNETTPDPRLLVAGHCPQHFSRPRHISLTPAERTRCAGARRPRASDELYCTVHNEASPRRSVTMSEPSKISVIYYSSTGTVYELAKAVAEGAAQTGADVRMRKVRELAPELAISANPAWAEHAAATSNVPIAVPEDVMWADAVVFGTPTRFGNVASQLKQFLDTLGGLWAEGQLADKVYSGFVAASTRHGGLESTLLALYNSFHHFGGIVVAPGYTDASKFVDGNPYGTSYVTQNPAQPVDDVARKAALYQGARVAWVAAALRYGRRQQAA